MQSTDIEMALMKFIVKDRLAISKLDSIHLNDLISGASFLFFVNFMESILMSDDNIFSLLPVCLNKGRLSSASQLESMRSKRTGNYFSRHTGTEKIKVGFMFVKK